MAKERREYEKRAFRKRYAIIRKRHEEELEHLHYVAKVNECNELMDYQIYQARLKDHEEELDRFEWARQRRADDEAMAREEQAVRRQSHTERMEQYERADKRLLAKIKTMYWRTKSFLPKENCRYFQR